MSDKDLRVERTAHLLRHQVSEKLREAIFDMRFPPGARLVERELCDLMGVSRTLIREALRKLEGEGLVQLTPRGPIVSTLTPEEARQLYDVRAALEGLAGRRCAEQPTPQVVASLRSAFRSVEQTYTDESAPGSVKLAAKTRFYEALFEGAGNPILTEQLRMLHGRINLLRAASLSARRTMQSLVEIRRIVRAVEKRDPDAAWRACVDHVERATIVALAIMEAKQRGGATRVRRPPA